jgi:nitroreductase
MEYEPVPLPDYEEYPEAIMRARAEEYYAEVKRRHSVRSFADRSVPRDIIETCIRAAGTAPSGANHQPWHFVCIENRAMKERIWEAAELEEEAFYGGKAGEEWLADLRKMGTDAQKPFLTKAAWLIAVFLKKNEMVDGEVTQKNYYMSESCGIAVGFLINALHHAGLATLTHTPSPMGFLGEILERPTNERPYLLLVAGYPTEDAQIPKSATIKKPLYAIATFI